jgi:hypothetical protein
MHSCRLAADVQSAPFNCISTGVRNIADRALPRDMSIVT